jgi:hypothetical protein
MIGEDYASFCSRIVLVCRVHADFTVTLTDVRHVTANHLRFAQLRNFATVTQMRRTAMIWPSKFLRMGHKSHIAEQPLRRRVERRVIL